MRKYRVQDDFASQLTAIYTRYNPEKLVLIPEMVEKFKGREGPLLLELHKKYGISEKDRYLVQGQDMPPEEDFISAVVDEEISDAYEDVTPPDADEGKTGTTTYPGSLVLGRRRRR